MVRPPVVDADPARLGYAPADEGAACSAIVPTVTSLAVPVSTRGTSPLYGLMLPLQPDVGATPAGSWRLRVAVSLIGAPVLLVALTVRLKSPWASTEVEAIGDPTWLAVMVTSSKAAEGPPVMDAPATRSSPRQAMRTVRWPVTSVDPQKSDVPTGASARQASPNGLHLSTASR